MRSHDEEIINKERRSFLDAFFKGTITVSTQSFWFKAFSLGFLTVIPKEAAAQLIPHGMWRKRSHPQALFGWGYGS
ncbi:hypothetical protein ACYTX7_09485, partial [Streptococcus pyogenes]